MEIVERSRINTYLDTLLADVQDLPVLESWWPGGDEEARFVEHEEWRNETSNVSTLERYRRAGGMTLEQEGRFIELKAGLWEAAPILGRLGLEMTPDEVLAG